MNQHIRRGIFKLALAGAFAISATASPAASALAVTTGGGMITTVAGATRTAPVGLRGSETSLFYPQGAMGLYALGVQPPGGGWYSTPVKIGIDAAGNLYIPDTLNNRVLKLSLGPSGTTRDGMISLVAGTGAGVGGDDAVGVHFPHAPAGGRAGQHAGAGGRRRAVFARLGDEDAPIRRRLGGQRTPQSGRGGRPTVAAVTPHAGSRDEGDRAVTRGALHRNAAARKKSQAARLVSGSGS